MRFCNLVQEAGSILMPKEFSSSSSCRGPKDLIGGVGEVGKTVLGLTKKELRRLKRREKENLWKRNRRNAAPEPLVVHLPKEPSPRSALQTVHKETGKAREHHWYQGGVSHEWVGAYHRGIASDQSCVNEWNAMEGLESKRAPSPHSLNNKEETEVLIRGKLKEIMTSVDIDEVTSKYIRTRLEEDLKADLFQFKSFIDMEMLTILGQMDAATQIFPHVYLGSEWNASNLDELRNNGVGFILNVTKEIDNFFPGMFDYLNIRVYDDEKTELLRHWDDTYKYISQVKEKGSKVLVHCKMGISRSASVVIAYAMKAQNLSLGEATDLVKNKRSCIKPNQAFTSQLKIYQGILDASRQRHNALFRSKSETNLKSSAMSPPTARLSYTPRGGGMTMAIPDFKPKEASSASCCPVSCHEGNTEESLAAIRLQSSPPSLHVRPPTALGRRPRSWSPDEETSKILTLEPYEESDFGEGLQKSRSLNDQAWQAHVTLVQRDLRDPGGGMVEALNPLYVTSETSPGPTSSERLKELQLSSSVKERINEFESAKVTATEKGSVGGGLANKKTLFITLDSVTTTSSTDCGGGKSEGEEEEDAAPLPHFGIPAATFEDCISKEPFPTVDECPLPDAPVVVRNEPIPWPSGIVRKQKEDFEGKVKLLEKAPKAGKDPEATSPPPRLSRQGSSLSLSAIEGPVEAAPSSGMEVVVGGRKEDLFSVRVDRVFDREEKKDDGKTFFSAPPKEEDSPSRNNSWGSFDSAVVLPDRDAPSRQSSWGSCDTRLSGSSYPSRNSSFGAFDGKQHCAGGGGGYTHFSDSSATNPQSSHSAFGFDKEASSLRKIRLRAPNSTSVLPEEAKGAGALKVYALAPFKAQGEVDEKIDSSTPPGPVLSFEESKVELNSLARSHSDGNAYSPFVGGLAAVSRGLKTSPQTPEHEIPLPGTVKQQRQKLESKSRQNGDNLLHERLSVPGIGRSLSSGCVSTYSHPPEPARHEKKWHITRSSSEKRCKTDMEGAKGNVKKLTRALETQKVPKPSSTSLLKQSRSLKQNSSQIPKPTSILRSQSLERLGAGPPPSPRFSPSCSSSSSSPPTPNKRWSSSSLRRDRETSSQNFLDHLVGEAQAQVHLLEKEQEEINVKNLVGLFEDGRSWSGEKPCDSSSCTECECVGENRLKRKASRPRSESMGERSDLLPPVPQRKSSLDYSSRPAAPKSPPGGSSLLRQYASLSPSAKAPPSVANGVGGGECPKPSPCSPKLPPPPPPSQGGASRACGSEVRRRKQSAKSHPISKLTPRENTL